MTRAVGWLAGARKAVALTGAGISVDSGIPDFRSAGGLWEKFDPMEYATIHAFRRDPAKVWAMLFELGDVVRSARPNPAHEALAALEQAARLAGVITQNIDNLHQAAGSRVVIEYHGNGRRLVCLACLETFDAVEFDKDALAKRPPRCSHCEAILKPDVVLFGEEIPRHAATESMRLAQACDVMLVIGTSAEVFPAAELPAIAKMHGAKVVELNRETTKLSRLADATILGSASDTLPELARRAGVRHGNN
ncbi:NAD-dependent deacylase [bacterium]|nr:NAD-dependent deacylase [bacterium]